MRAWHAPGRVNLIGEHTDYNAGLVLPFALPQGVTVRGKRRDDGILDLASDGLSERVVLDGLVPGAVSGWAAYVAGVAGCMIEAGHRITGATLRFSSDLPRGAGLSSSAALECATAVALRDLFELPITGPELAALAQRAENRYAGVPCGILDQAASVLCRPDHALLMDCRDGGTTQVPLDFADHLILVVDTRAEHVHTDGGYAQRRADCERAAGLLGVASLREVTDLETALVKVADPVLGRRLRHVVSENRRVERVVDVLRSGSITRVGPLLTASHLSLRDQYEVSWPEADTTVATALAAGAAGARMIGGGFGGSVIALVPRPLTPTVTKAIDTAFTTRSWPTPAYIEATAAPGARPL